MPELAAVTDDLGPATEARFAAAFSNKALLNRSAAAKLLGIDPKTLCALADAGVVRSVRAGASKVGKYTERDLRAYLIDSPRVGPPAAAAARPRGGATGFSTWHAPPKPRKR